MNDHEFYDIYPTWHIPWWQTRAWYITLIIGLFLVLALLVVWYKKRFKKPILLSPAQKATQALEMLAHKYASQKIKLDQVYVMITTIIKIYLQELYSLSLLDKTDHELVLRLADSQFPTNLLPNLEQLMQGAVQIKFANQDALAHQIEQDIARAKLIIECTSLPDKV
jgi:hypothetical protein